MVMRYINDVSTLRIDVGVSQAQSAVMRRNWLREHAR